MALQHSLKAVLELFMKLNLLIHVCFLFTFPPGFSCYLFVSMHSNQGVFPALTNKKNQDLQVGKVAETFTQ